MVFSLKASNLPRWLDALPNAEVADDPAQDETQGQFPPQAAHLLNATGDVQNPPSGQRRGSDGRETEMNDRSVISGKVRDRMTWRQRGSGVTWREGRGIKKQRNKETKKQRNKETKGSQGLKENNVCELCLLPELHNGKSAIQSGRHAEAHIWMAGVHTGV